MKFQNDSDMSAGDNAPYNLWIQKNIFTLVISSYSLVPKYTK